MRELYPSSTGRKAAYLEDILQELVPDATRSDPASRQFQAINPMVEALDRTKGLVRRADTRPWKGDVRQAGAVEAGTKSRGGGLEDLPERREDELVFGKPDDIELRELRRYPRPSAFVGGDGTLADTLRVIEAGGELRVDAAGTLYRVTENGEQESLEAPDFNWRRLGTDNPAPNGSFVAVSNEPGSFALAPAPGVLNREVGVQREGLDVLFAGRGTCEIDVTYTGTTPVEDGDDLSGITRLQEGLKLYGPDGEEHSYNISSGVISIPQAEGGEEFTLYYEGLYTTTYKAKGSGPLGQALEHSISLKPIAPDLAELPSTDTITCTETTNHIAEVPIQGRSVGVTEDGYVGNTFLGHQIHHVLPGPRHVLAVGDGTLSICEPEAGTSRQFSVPSNAVGVTWTDEGLLGLVVDDGSDFILHGINEIRRGHTDGLSTIPPLG